VCDLETSRMGAPYIYDISRLRVKKLVIDNNFIVILTLVFKMKSQCFHNKAREAFGH